MDRKDPTPELAATEAGETVDERHGAARASYPEIITGDRYRYSGDIGAGGMGEVIAAHDVQIGREVAVKRMRAKDPSERAVGRFMREARIQGRLEHPAIPPVHELGRDVDGRPYFAMKKLAGRSLSDILEDGQTTRQRLLRAFCDVCNAIEFAHTRGVLHRDLKPDNIMLGEFGETYVLDWGVAKLLGDALDADDGYEGSDSARNATATGAAIGTPGYMAPEQVAGDPNIDARADVYALGCVLFEILAGEGLHPRGPSGMMSAVEGKDGRPSARAPDRDIPPELDALCAAATATRRDDRLATAKVLGDGVQRYLDGDRDGAMRAELAVKHEEAAAAAFAAGDRALAMREAARTLALDPKKMVACQIVARLMLDPPATVPPAVTDQMDRDARQITVEHGRLALFGYMTILVFVPLVFAISAPIYGALLFASLAFAMIVAWLGAKGRNISVHLFLFSAASVIAVLSQEFSPIAFPVAGASVIALVLLMNPRFEPWPRLTGGAVMLGSILLPWLAQWLGWLPRTYVIDEHGVLLDGVGLRAGETITTALIVATTLSTVLVGVAVGYGIRTSEFGKRQRLHLQAWQLRQLMPENVA